MPWVASVKALTDWPSLWTIQSVVFPFSTRVFRAQVAVHMRLLRAW